MGLLNLACSQNGAVWFMDRLARHVTEIGVLVQLDGHVFYQEAS